MHQMMMPKKGKIQFNHETFENTYYTERDLAHKSNINSIIFFSFFNLTSGNRIDKLMPIDF